MELLEYCFFHFWLGCKVIYPHFMWLSAATVFAAAVMACRCIIRGRAK